MAEQLTDRQRRTLSNAILNLQAQNAATREKIERHRTNPNLTEAQREGMIRRMRHNITERERTIASIRARLDAQQDMAA